MVAQVRDRTLVDVDVLRRLTPRYPEHQERLANQNQRHEQRDNFVLRQNSEDQQRDDREEGDRIEEGEDIPSAVRVDHTLVQGAGRQHDPDQSEQHD